MKNGMVVFDAVIHALNLSDDAAVSGREAADSARLIREHLGGFAALTAERGPEINPALARPPEHDWANKMLFEEAETDFALAQTVPLLHWFKDGAAPAELNYKLAQSNPERIFFCGGVDPLVSGVPAALEEMERQAEEWGAVSFKFYQAQSPRHVWRADDEKIAYPLWEKALELDVKLVQFHKGFPLAKQRVEDLRPNDLQLAALDFPGLNFGMHHHGDPYVDETISILSRFENVYLILPLWFNQYFLQPREMLKRLGKTLLFCGDERICYGSEAFTWPKIQPYIDLWATLQMPKDLQEGYGYPPITDETRRNVFGLNLARALGIDLNSKLQQVSEVDA